MADIATALMAQLQRSVAAVQDTIAKDGLQLLQSVLRDAGFDKSEYLQDYELFAHTSGGGEIVFEIAIPVEALEETDLSDMVAEARQEAMENLEKKFEEATVKSFGLSRDGQVYRIATLRDKRKTSHDTKRPSRDTKRKSRDTKHGSTVREFDHKAAASAPRSLGAPMSMQVGRSGKLHLTFTRKLRSTASGGTKYPSTDFEGIMKKFVDGMQDVVAQRFLPQLEKVLSAKYSE